MKSVRWALLAAVVGLSIGGAETSDAAIFDYSYKFDSTGSTFSALFDGVFRPDNNIFDISGVSSVSVNGVAINDSFNVSGWNIFPPSLSRDGAFQDFYIERVSNYDVFISSVPGSGVGANSSLGGSNMFEAYNSANFNGRAAGPGAPAPEVGVGLLSILAAGVALAFTRFRRLSAPLPA